MSLRAYSLIHVCRSLLRFWGMSLLNIFGLAIGFSAAIILGLYVRNELDFDRFIVGADRTLMVTTVYSPPNSPVVSTDKSPAGLAGWLRADAPEAIATARLYPIEWSVRSPKFTSLEYFYWADPNFFDLLRIEAVAGDLKTALAKPYTAVLTQKMARRYFGREDVLGQTLFINGSSPVVITAVLRDFPANTSLDREIFVSGLSHYSMLFILDKSPPGQWASCYTFVRLKPDGRLTSDKVKDIATRRWQSGDNFPVKFNLVPLSEIHFLPEADSQIATRGHRDTVFAMAAVSVVILLIAAANLAGLLTAQIDERRAEMDVRRSLGARRHHLFLHMLSEALVINLIAVIAGVALTERLLPVINGLMALELSLWTSLGFVACFALGAVFVGMLGGLYPAAVLSLPGEGSSAGSYSGSHSYFSRVGWIAVQFTLLITLLISSQIVYRQWIFASGTALNFDADHVLQIVIYGMPNQYEFKRRILAVPGVENAAFSRFTPEDREIRPGWSKSPDGQRIQFNRQSVDTNFFDVFKVRLLAGKNFSGVSVESSPPREVILSLSATKALGYGRPVDAVGHVLEYEADHTRMRSTIIGVVDDMRTNTVRKALQPKVFDSQSFFFTRLNVKLKAGDETATLAAIDRAWQLQYPNTNSIDRHFYSDYLVHLYRDMIQQWWAFALLSVVGICLSVLGLSGLSIYLARARSREIAIRNALGAQLRDIIRFRLQPFVKPLLFAHLAAGLLSWLLMSWWLSSFDSHIQLTPVVFLTAGGLTVLISVITLTAHILVTSPARSSRPLGPG